MSFEQKGRIWRKHFLRRYRERSLLTILHLDLTTEISLDNEYPRHPVNVSFLPCSLQNGQFQEKKEQACTWEEGKKQSC